MVREGSFRLLIVGVGRSEITFLNRLIAGLANSGVEVTLAVPDRSPVANFPSGSVRWFHVPAWEGSPLLRLLRVLALFLTRFSFRRVSWLKRQLMIESTPRDRLKALFRYLPFMKGTWDAIYFPWNATAVDYPGLYYLDIPVLVSCRGSQVNVRPHLFGQQGYRQGLTRSLSQASAVHCVSRAILEEARQYGLDESKAVVIHPAVDPAFFHPAPTPPPSDTLRLITTGSLVWVKGWEYLLLALRALLDSGTDAHLSIIGEGPELSRVLFTIKDLHLEHNVTCHGKLEPSEVRDLLQASHIFVLSSLSEGLSNAALEAMSCSLPVVITACGGLPEAVSDAVEGFLVLVRDPQNMAAAINRLAADEDLRRRMGSAARERVLREFTLAGQVELFASLLKSLPLGEK